MMFCQIPYVFHPKRDVREKWPPCEYGGLCQDKLPQSTLQEVFNLSLPLSTIWTRCNIIVMYVWHWDLINSGGYLMNWQDCSSSGNCGWTVSPSPWISKWRKQKIEQRVTINNHILKKQLLCIRWECVMHNEGTREQRCWLTVSQHRWIVPISARSVFFTLVYVCLSLSLPPPSCFSHTRIK